MNEKCDPCFTRNMWTDESPHVGNGDLCEAGFSCQVEVLMLLLREKQIYFFYRAAFSLAGIKKLCLFRSWVRFLFGLWYGRRLVARAEALFFFVLNGILVILFLIILKLSPLEAAQLVTDMRTIITPMNTFFSYRKSVNFHPAAPKTRVRNLTLSMMTVMTIRSNNPSPAPVKIISILSGRVMNSTRTSAC